METTRRPYEYPSGQTLFLDALPESVRIVDGECNLFLLPRSADGHTGERVFLAVLRSGDCLSPEPPLEHDGVAHVLAAVASGDVRCAPAPDISEAWLHCIREAVSRVTRLREEADSIPALLTALLEANKCEKGLRLERLRQNRVLTERFMQKKLDSLRQVCGAKNAETSTEEREKNENYLLESALRNIAEHYRLPLKEKPFNELRKLGDLPYPERARRFAVAANWRMRTIHLTPGFHKLSARPILAFREEDGRPLVLHLKAEGSTFWDPALGDAPRPLTAAIAGQLSPEACCFYEPFPAGKKNRKTLLQFIFATARQALVTIFLVGLISALIGLVMPVATQYVTGSIIPTGNLPELRQLAILLVVLTVCQISLGMAPSLVLMLFGTQQYERFQAAMFDHVLRMPVATFQMCDSGDMTQRILGASQVQAAVFDIISGQFLGSVFSLISLCMMFYYSPVLAGVGALVVVFYALTFFLLSKINLRPLAVQAAASGRISGLMKQFFDGMLKIRGAGAEQQVLSRFLDDFLMMSRNSAVISRNGAILKVVFSLFPMLISVLFYGLAGGFLDKNLPLPIFLAFMAAFQNFQGGLMGFSQGCWALLAIEPSVQRFMPLLESEPEDAGERYLPGELDGAVAVSHLCFRYAPDAPLVLNDLSLTAEPGAFIAIVGPSGSGKSSLVRLLLGFENPESGGVYYSGKDLATLDLRAVRRQMGVILQNSKILPGSILENITTGTGHTLEDAWEALRLAAFDKDVEAMPMGIHTLVSPETISGGQQQRILIARALVGKPSIIIMDESTSALDNRTQDTVTSNMERLRMTRIVIAHRLSTIKQADRIYVLEKGELRQAGSYAELCAVDGLFKRLVERQLTDNSVQV
ncbi:ATP-binding cassette domain-containing protein [Desulfovibrio sp. OttesenSCG-928-M14]|nr:ATP-binding cassette domain-containing protein [Desulfovibrio sp. OttesenSCG-928-M14]